MRGSASHGQKMGSLGENLRKEREARGISLEEISQQTKISVRLLRFIEEEHFEQLPGGIFNKNFVRQYARYVGLDEETAIQQYLQVISTNRETPPIPKTPLPEAYEPALGIGYPRLILTAVILGALIAGIVYGVYRFRERLTGSNQPTASALTEADRSLQYGSTDGNGTQDPATGISANAGEALPGNGGGADSTAASSSQPSLPETASSAAGERSDSRSEARDSATIPGEELQLEIASRGTVWLSIAADGETYWQGTMRANETRQVKAQDSVRMTIGDAGAVELILNGKPLPPAGKAGEVKTITVTAKGFPAPPT
ncbi:MAG: hypothetical protein A3H27_17695 [Acidobacteria bacterium RIFCSPLOWO2_02_FULL_59_13]|nr:MAG: hypothetical protein A3H27_17695 [Acidobacteria bacterium RIFCSPLOWO2_02_FULL_59_13]